MHVLMHTQSLYQYNAFKHASVSSKLVDILLLIYCLFLLPLFVGDGVGALYLIIVLLYAELTGILSSFACILIARESGLHYFNYFPAVL